MDFYYMGDCLAFTKSLFFRDFEKFPVGTLEKNCSEKSACKSTSTKCKSRGNFFNLVQFHKKI
jgi:hypothetical protein